MQSVCSEPFKLFGNGHTKEEPANNDSFELDLNNEMVYWKDSKGTTKSMIYNLQNGIVDNRRRMMFNTKHNIYRITMSNKTAVIEIMFKNNDQWYCLSYLCNIKTI